MGPRHVVVIGSQRSNLLLPRCQSNFKWVLPELWFSPSSWLKQKTVVVLNYKPWHSSPTGISVSWISKWMVGRIMLRASGGNNMAQHPLCVCVCFPAGHACICTISLCAFKHIFSFPSAVSVPGSNQHLDQQVSPSCTSTITLSSDLHLPEEGEATQLLTFSKTMHTASYCNWAPAVFQNIKQSTDSLFQNLELLYIHFALFHFTFDVS